MHRGWLKYFVVALGMGLGAVHAQEQVMLNYWWVMPDEPEQSAPRVIRVTGAKGEHFEEVYDESDLAALRTTPAVLQARQARQAALRREAQELARQYRSAGKSAALAYEEAWVEVYSRHWLSSDWYAGSSKLEEMLTRMASDEEEQELTPQEKQWVLEALLEDDDRIESQAGYELLLKLSRRLRELGYGSLKLPCDKNDELMAHYVEALQHGMDSMAAYRDALFKVKRDRVMHYELKGYRAPMGFGIGGPSYRQAPVKVSQTTGTGNTQVPESEQPVAQQNIVEPVLTTTQEYAAPGLNDLPAAVTDFRASSPELSASADKDDEKEKDEEEQEEEEILFHEAAVAVTSSSAPAPMLRSFAMRSVASTYAADDGGAVTLAENAITSGTNTTYHANATVNGQTLSKGNMYGASWNPSASNKATNGDATATVNYATWDNGVATGTVTNFNLAGGNLYLGSGYTGTITVSGEGSVLHAESLEHNSQTATAGWWFWQTTATAHAVYQVPGSGEFRYGRLEGSGSLTLSNNAVANNAVIYIFDESNSVGWFGGTVSFGASRGGITELDLGAGGATTAWAGTVFDLSATGVGTAGYGISSSENPAATILNIRNNVSIAGLEGGDATSTVTSQSGDSSYTLTLGDAAGKDYTYGGTFNGRYYISATSSQNSAAPFNLKKVNANTQTFTQDMTGNSALNILSVEDGALVFAQGVGTKFTRVSGGQLQSALLNVTGEQVGDPELYITGGSVNVSGAVTVLYDAGVVYDDSVGKASSLSAGSLSVGNLLLVSGSKASVTVGGATTATGVQVTGGATMKTGSLSASSELLVGAVTRYSGDGALSSLIVNGDMSTSTLRLRADASLTTQGATTITGESHMHGGASWTMSGTANYFAADSLLKIEGLGDTPIVLTGSGATETGDVVLTLPGVISFADAGWNDATQVVFDLNGVTLNFSHGVTLTNLGFSVSENQTIYLATTTATGGYLGTAPTVTVSSSDGNFWHANVVSRSEDGQDYVVLTIQNKIEKPVEIGQGALHYIEMQPDAASPALPYLAYTDGVYKNATWSGTEVSRTSLIKYANVQLAEGADLYLGEKDGDAAHLHFGGNIQVDSSAGSTEAARLHGQIGSWGNWLLDGNLGGKGDAILVAHHGNGNANTPTPTTTTNTDDDKTVTKVTTTTVNRGTASVFTFTDVETPESWLQGRLQLTNPDGGTVQLNIGNVNIAGQGDTRWQNVVVDLTQTTLKDAATGTSGTSALNVLALQGNATVAGLKGNASSVVVSGVTSTASANVPTLTLGSDDSATFSGVLGSGFFYTGGQACTVTKVTQVTPGNGGAEWSTTTVEETNGFTTLTGNLNLKKVGSGAQTLDGTTYLNTATVEAGTLVLAGTAQIAHLQVQNGATAQTGANVTLGSLTLAGGSTWNLTSGYSGSYDLPLYLAEVSSPITITGNSGATWTPSLYMNMAGTGTPGTSHALFSVDNKLNLTLGNSLVLTNVSGVTEGSEFKLYGGKSFSSSIIAGKSVLVEDTNSQFYNARYEVRNNEVYVILGDKRDYGIVVEHPDKPDQLEYTLKGYIWSGVNSGTTVSDVHHINLTMGSIWRADGSAADTGWHEQRAAGSSNDDIGIYQNGHTVYFEDLDVHGESSPVRKVQIVGKVAPGKIFVTADKNDGKSGSSEAQMEYGYAFVSADGSGSIVDWVNEQGTLVKTSITKTGDSLLVINTYNTFSGGIDVQDGGLYLAAENAAGTGKLSFHVDKKWSYKVVGSSTSSGLSVEMSRTGAELMVCYPHSDDHASGFRGPSILNDIELVGGDSSAGQFRISFAHASYNEKSTGDDHANVPRHWRNLTLSGALIGAGYNDGEKWINTSGNDTIYLTGYSSTWRNVRDQSYVTQFTLNEANADTSLYKKDANGNILNRFAGTVKLENTVNTSPLSSNTLSNRIAGTVQVTLSGDKLGEALLDMTRESVNWSGESSPRQTYNNILVINGNASLRGLTASFLGSGYYFPESGGTSGEVSRSYNSSLSNTSEVWHVRTVTNGLNTLYLGSGADTADTTYVYSGALGYAQAYAGNTEAHVPWGDGFFQHTDPNWYFGGHSMGQQTLSLTKSGLASQYIHTASIQDLSLYAGTLGFNNLVLTGNMNLVSNSTLDLGVTGTIGSETWHNNGSNMSGYERKTTSDSVSMAANKTLTVITSGTQVQNGVTVPQTAWVNGNLALDNSSNTLTFLTSGNMPYGVSTSTITNSVEQNIVPLLHVSGSLNLDNALTVNLTGIDFSSTDYKATRYYLAAADKILVDGVDKETNFTKHTISLGYGYFGTVYTVGNNGNSLTLDRTDYASSMDYLVMTVNGDPRRTWSGMMCQTNVADDSMDYITSVNYTWDSTSSTDETPFDYRWKENLPFVNGHVVLFGNLYQPVKWKSDSAELTSADTVDVNAPLHAGTLVQNTAEAATYDFNVGGYSLESLTGTSGFQAVKVSGRVAPFSVVINSDYWLYEDGTKPEKSTGDSTNYYFYTTQGDMGAIHDVDLTNDPVKLAASDSGWLTTLHKSGDGTVVMALDNRYTGGTVLQGGEKQGGRLVMQHVNALGYVYNTGAYASDDPNTKGQPTGKACSITLMNGAGLHGDFDDAMFPGNYVEDGNVALGKAMETTTIRNTVIVNVYADPNDANYDAKIDGRLYNTYDKKLILATLEGESDTVLELNGVGLGTGDKYRYGVFKVLNPGKFYGTVSMNGHVWGTGLGTGAGMVQLDVMSTAKSAEGQDWLNATVDLSVKEGTDRTVLALDVMSSGEVCELNSITGTVRTGGSSSVLNMSKHNAATLRLMGTRNGDYEGVLGYGDFQVAVNYGGYGEEQQGTTQHHYGAVGYGSLNVEKLGVGSHQSVSRAWLNALDVQGGVFQAKEAMVAHTIKAGGGPRVMVGKVTDTSTLYALTVENGVLAMNTTLEESGSKTDAWGYIKGGTTAGDTTTAAGWVSLKDGAVLSAREDWFTAKPIDIGYGAAVTINTHNFAIDPHITASNDVFGKYYHSHIIQLLGTLKGRDVQLTVNNCLTDPANNDKPVQNVADENKYMGYAAIRDFNGFNGTNSVSVGEMTVLQLLGNNAGQEADVTVTVAGKHATLQITDMVWNYTTPQNSATATGTQSDTMEQYIHKLVLGENLEVASSADTDPLVRGNNGQLLLGGKERRTLVPEGTAYLKSPDMADMQILISSRHAEEGAVGTINNLHVDLRGSAVKLGGCAEVQTVMDTVHVDVARSNVSHTVHHTDLVNSLVHLQEDCSVDIREMVLLDSKSAIHGIEVDYYAVATDDVLKGPTVASGKNPTSKTKEVGTSVGTTVQLTFAEQSKAVDTINGENILVLQAEQFKGVDVTGSGLTIHLFEEEMFTWAYEAGARFVAVQIGGGFGHFLYEVDNNTMSATFKDLLGSQFVMYDKTGQKNLSNHWVSSAYVNKNLGGNVEVSSYMLYFEVPEPTTTTLGLVALAALCARRRRK